MSKVAVIAEFKTKPGTFAQFLERMKQHAAASRQEPGCLRFDIVIPQGGSDHMMLYELYRDQASFDFHAGTDRIKAHRKATADWMAERKVTVCQLVDGDL